MFRARGNPERHPMASWTVNLSERDGANGAANGAKTANSMHLCGHGEVRKGLSLSLSLCVGESVEYSDIPMTGSSASSLAWHTPLHRMGVWPPLSGYPILIPS